MRPTLALYYATVSGNAEALARQAEARALREGWLPHLRNLSSLKPTDLANHPLALFIVSTWGDGEPPDDAADFWFDLTRSTPDLSHLRYAVLGLGDRGYAEFNAFARDLDERLAALGAHPLHPRVEADAYYDDTYAEWESHVFPLLTALVKKHSAFAEKLSSVESPSAHNAERHAREPSGTSLAL